MPASGGDRLALGATGRTVSRPPDSSTEPSSGTASRRSRSSKQPGHVTRAISGEVDRPNALVASPSEERLCVATNDNDGGGAPPALQRRLASSSEAASITISAAPGLYGDLSTS